MPTITLKRIWCKTCNEFELHATETIFGKEWFCNKCATEYIDGILYSEIPEEKLIAQRVRYKEKQRKDMGDVYSQFIMGGGLSGMFDTFSEVGSNTEIYESDAGQIQIDKAMKLKRDEAYEKRRIQRVKDLELKQSFHKLGRNDKCLCGSEKKYKKCCYQKIQKI